MVLFCCCLTRVCLIQNNLVESYENIFIKGSFTLIPLFAQFLGRSWIRRKNESAFPVKVNLTGLTQRCSSKFASFDGNMTHFFHFIFPFEHLLPLNQLILLHQINFNFVWIFVASRTRNIVEFKQILVFFDNSDQSTHLFCYIRRNQLLQVVLLVKSEMTQLKRRACVNFQRGFFHRRLFKRFIFVYFSETVQTCRMYLVISSNYDISVWGHRKEDPTSPL